MPALATNLKSYRNNGDKRTYQLADTTTAEKPRLVIQTRVTSEGGRTVLKDILSVVITTEDPEGAILSQRIVGEVSVRRPINGVAADVDSCIAEMRALVASDEFAAMVDTQEWIKE